MDSHGFGKGPSGAYQDVLNEFDSIWGAKDLIMTRSNLMVKWKARPHMGIIYLFPLIVQCFLPRWLYFGSFYN